MYASIVVRSRKSLAYGSRYARHVSDSLRDIRRSRRVLIFIKKIRVQHWYRVRLLSSESRHDTRKFNRRRHLLCHFLRDRHFAPICRCALSARDRRDCRYCRDRRCRCRAARRDCGCCCCYLDLSRRRRRCRTSIKSGTQLSYAAVLTVLIRIMSSQPSESTPATNTRRRAADRRARAGLSSRVESDRPNAPQGVGLSVVCLPPTSRLGPPSTHQLLPHRRCHTPRPQPLNPAPLDSVLSALLFQIKQLSSQLASLDAAKCAAKTAVSDRLNRLERSRSDGSNRESANWQSVRLPPSPQPATVVVESRESKQDRVHTFPEDVVLDPMRY